MKLNEERNPSLRSSRINSRHLCTPAAPSTSWVSTTANFLPSGQKFAVVLTHDVEGAAGVHRCRELMRLERRLGFRSSFNFIPEGNYKVPSELRNELASHGFEIGIHDLKHDGRLFASRREFSRKALRINGYLRDWNAAGFRSGFMLH